MLIYDASHYVQDRWFLLNNMTSFYLQGLGCLRLRTFFLRDNGVVPNVDNFFFLQTATYRSCQETTHSCVCLLRKSIKPFPYTATTTTAMKIYYIMVERPPLKCTHAKQGYEIIFLSFLFRSSSIPRILDIYLYRGLSEKISGKKNIVNSRIIINF